MWIPCILSLGLLNASPDYSALIDQLAGDERTAGKAHSELMEAGKAAFPALLTRMNDRTKIENGLFQAEAVELTPAGTYVLHKPTIGEVCFEIIQYQIEGCWPKGFRDYYALHPDNVATWLAENADKRIREMRLTAVEQSLRAVKRDLNAKPYLDDELKYLEARLRKLQAETRQ